MASPTKIMMRAFLSHYKHGLDNVKSSVDVADGIRGHVVETNLIIELIKFYEIIWINLKLRYKYLFHYSLQLRTLLKKNEKERSK